MRQVASVSQVKRGVGRSMNKKKEGRGRTKQVANEVRRDVAHLYENGNHRIDVPAFAGAVFVSCYEGVGGNERLELRLSHIQKRQHFLHDGADVVPVDEGK